MVETIPNFRNNRLLTYFTIMFSDVLALALSGFAAVVVRRFYQGQFAISDYAPFAAVLPVFIFIYGLAGLYPGVALNPVDELRRIFHATTVGYLIVIAGTFLVKVGPNYSRLVFLGAWISGVLLVILSRNLVRSHLCNKTWWGIPIVIFGAGTITAAVPPEIDCPWEGATQMERSIRKWFSFRIDDVRTFSVGSIGRSKTGL